MLIYNRYIITIAILFVLSTAILAASGINTFGIYYVIYIVEAFIVTELYRHLIPQTRRGLNVVSIILLVGFLPVIMLQFIRLLA